MVQAIFQTIDLLLLRTGQRLDRSRGTARRTSPPQNLGVVGLGSLYHVNVEESTSE